MAGDGSKMVPCVELRSVTKRFGELVAVDDLSLAVPEGDFFTLLGPSGCGKTTTLRMVAGFEEATSGRVLIDGEDVAGVPPYKRPTNTVFQSYALFPHLSVEDNVAFGLKRKRVGSDEIERRIREELERVGLSAEANRRPAQLSGGQQQRVALARALVNLPKVLLLDEPLGALDLKLRKGLQVQLKQIQRDVGITFLYVTHDQEEALTMSDRIAVMNQGRIEQVADPEQVYDKPATTFVAGFIGVSNLMPGVVKSSGGNGEVLLDSGVTVEAEVNGFAVGERCNAVVRPEKLAIAPADEKVEGKLPSVEGLVESSLYLGTSTQMLVRLPDDVVMTVLAPNTDEEERQEPPRWRGEGEAFMGARAHASRARVRSRRRQGRECGRAGAGRLITTRRNHVSNTRLRAFMLVALALAASLAIAACGGDDNGVGGADETEATVAQGGEPTGEVLISNWPGYVDPGPNGTIPQFEQQSGVETEYKEDVNDNVVFFNKVKPQLDQGDAGGREHLRRHRLDGEADVRPRLSAGDQPRRPADGVREHPAAIRGIDDGPRTQVLDSVAGRPDRRLRRHERSSGDRCGRDLFDPKYKGKVTMLTEMRDTVPLILQSEGVTPDEATKEDWLAAIDKLREARDSGQIRRFTGNEYTEDLTSGNIVAAIGWSGDTSLIGREDVEWRRPTDGCDLFFDQAVIPIGAPNTAAALAFLNFAYTPENAAEHHGVRAVRDAGRRRAADPRPARSEAGERPEDLPDRGGNRTLF